MKTQKVKPIPMKLKNNNTYTVEEDVLQQIVKLIEPERIFCERNFLLIVLSNKFHRPHSDYRILIEPTIKEFNSFVYTLLNSSELQSFLNQGQLFYSSICRPDCLIYESNQAPLMLNLNQRIVKAITKASSNFQPGYKRAELFLKGANYYMQLGEWSFTVFMLHQATEQVLRSIIMAVTEQDVRTHSICELKQHLKNCAPHLINSLSGDKQNLLTILESSYSGSRYLNEYQVKKEIAESLMCEATLFVREVNQSFNQMINSFSSLQICQV